MCVPGGQGKASAALPLATLGSRPRPAGTGDHSQPPEVPPGVGVAGGRGQGALGTPTCWALEDGLQAALGALVANAVESSPPTAADPRDFQSEAPPGVQGPQTGFGESVTPLPLKKKQCKAVCARTWAHMCTVRQGRTFALIRLSESPMKTPGWGCRLSRGPCGQGTTRRDISIARFLSASGSLICNPGLFPNLTAQGLTRPLGPLLTRR